MHSSDLRALPAALALISGLGVLPTARGEDKLFLAETRHQSPATASRPSKLSPALRATRDARGVLKGADESGRPVVAVAESNVAAFTNSAAVRTVLGEVPGEWKPVRQLKLSYGPRGPLPEVALTAIGLKLIEDYSKGKFMVVEPIDRTIDSRLAERIEADANVRYATPALRVKAIPPSNLEVALAIAPEPLAAPPPANDALWPSLWNLRNIRADVAWKAVHDSPEVIVAVLDTGVDYDHEDLRGNMWSDPKGKHGFDFVGDDDAPMDLNGHGTHCAGTIGAVGANNVGIMGVSWKVKIMAVRWLDADGVGDVINAIKAIDYAVDHGAKVLSNSWYWYEDDPDLLAAIERAQAANVLVAVAAGNFAEVPNNRSGDNDNPGTRGRIPSAYDLDNIVAVAAIDRSEKLASFSNSGARSVDLAAPGVLITSTVLHNGYDGTYSGTSMATPHVAGALALTIAANPKLGPSDVRKLVLANVRKVPSLAGKCVTGGTLDLSYLSTGVSATPPAR